ncbi:hypothetical protein BJ742DRAFT_832334 [Cladochytrium replicatum]|nr:hypothetical protein BJ742DRAFT_832334 [Cladochytrium replicatum]
MSLTANAIRSLHQKTAEDRLVVQLLDIKKITTNAAQSSGVDRFRAVVSDGTEFCQVMLATQWNPAIVDGTVQKNSICLIKSHIINTVQSKMLVILVNFEVVESNYPKKIGTPIIFQDNNAGAVAGPSNPPAPPSPAARNAPPSMASGPGSFGGQKQVGGPGGNVNGGQSHFGGMAAPSSGGRGVGAAGWQQQNARPGFQSNSGGGSNMPPRPTDNAPRSTAITNLTPYSNKWTICARVVTKSDIRYFTNAKGEGKFFNLVLADQSGEIRASAFGDAVDQHYDTLQPNHVYYIAPPAKVKTANKKYAGNVANDYELALEATTSITLCTDQSVVPSVKYDFKKLSALLEIEKDAQIDVIGVVKDTGDVTEIVTRAQKPIKKRELTIVDDTEFQVRLTLWGNQAESFDGSDHPIVCVKGAKVGDYGGRSLSMLSSATMQINPDISECHVLRGWWENSGGQGRDFKGYSGAGGAMGGGQSGAGGKDLKPIQEAKDGNLGFGDKPDYFTARASVAYVKTDSVAYPACHSEGCNKKVTEDTISGGWRCEKCQKDFPVPNYRYIISASIADHTGQMWVQVFNDQAEVILGCSANDLMQLRESNKARADAIMSEMLFQEFTFRVRAKMETYQDESKIRYTVMGCTPLQFPEANEQLLDMIMQYQ